MDRDELKRLTETPVKDMSEIEVRRLKLEAKNALAEVERLQAGRDKLRTALERVVTYTYYYGEGGMPTLMAHEVRQIVFGALDETQRLEQSTSGPHLNGERNRSPYPSYRGFIFGAADKRVGHWRISDSLSSEASQRLAQKLMDPPEPNEALKKLMGSEEA